MASRLPITGQGNALLTACQDQEWPRHDSWHAKTRGGQGMASRLLVTGQGNAMLTACQDQGWPRHGKPIACHRARQCIGQGMTHGMPKQGVAKAWAKANFTTIGGCGLPPLGKPWPPDARCHGTLLSRRLGQFLAFWPLIPLESHHQAQTKCAQGKDNGKAIKAKAWQADCQSSGKAMHCSRHAKTKSGQGMTHGMPKQGEAKAWQADCLSPGEAMRCSRHAKQGVAKAWQADCLSPGKAMHWPRHDSWHAKTRGGQGMASRLLVTGQGMHCSRHSKTKGGQGMTHGMPKQGVAKAWQADCLSPGKAMRCSRHAKTRGGQGMAS
ncbi:hypothetical protein RHGRI_010913 [Rhododendron griersonianum]|uniref:Uncharacterized protein n=1 Tax=Rhododendron griersonianum TaxID=479676 RepID=A0AAV6KL73_9ERIC|nr:hypothetical protein RHGRI_010913 [Rhododendron griersonianum]